MNSLVSQAFVETTISSKLQKKHKTDFQRWQSALGRLAAISGWDEEDINWHFRRLKQARKKLLGLSKLASNGQKPNARRLQDHILNSYSARLCALLDQWVPKSVLETPKALTPQELEQKIAAIRPTRRLFDSTVVHAQGKPDGSKRLLHSPGKKVRAAQQLVGYVLDCWPDQSPNEFNVTGRGNHAAVTEVTRLIQEEGLRSFVLFDLKDFFSSVKPTHLKARLPVSNQVMKHTLFFNSEVILFHPRSLDAAEAETARHGLPSGARLYAR